MRLTSFYLAGLIPYYAYGTYYFSVFWVLFSIALVYIGSFINYTKTSYFIFLAAIAIDLSIKFIKNDNVAIGVFQESKVTFNTNRRGDVLKDAIKFDSNTLIKTTKLRQ